jgi:hypothetical protein
MESGQLNYLRVLFFTVLTAFFVFYLAMPISVFAGSAANPVLQTAVQPMDCIADIVDQRMSCTSNDIQLASGVVVEVNGAPNCVAGRRLRSK